MLWPRTQTNAKQKHGWRLTIGKCTDRAGHWPLPEAQLLGGRKQSHVGSWGNGSSYFCSIQSMLNANVVHRADWPVAMHQVCVNSAADDCWVGKSCLIFLVMQLPSPVASWLLNLVYWALSINNVNKPPHAVLLLPHAGVSASICSVCVLTRWRRNKQMLGQKCCFYFFRMDTHKNHVCSEMKQWG